MQGMFNSFTEVFGKLFLGPGLSRSKSVIPAGNDSQQSFIIPFLQVMSFFQGNRFIGEKREVMQTEDGIEADCVKVDDFEGMSAIPEAFCEFGENGVTKRLRIRVRDDDQDVQILSPVDSGDSILISLSMVRARDGL